MNLWIIILVAGQIIGWAGPLPGAVDFAECQRRADSTNAWAQANGPRYGIDTSDHLAICAFLPVHPKTLTGEQT